MEQHFPGLTRQWRSLLTIALLVGCAAGPVPPLPPSASASHSVSAASPTQPERPAPQMVATAHPQATEAGLRMLQQGGTAVDAAIAAQLMLGLVEPQSSGLGGGLLMVHWDAARQRLSTVDGLAAAPQRATASLRTDVDGSLLPSEPSQRGGRTVGVPGAMPAMIQAHRQHGRLPWTVLVRPALQAAEDGFAMPPYLHTALSTPEAHRALRPAFGLYFDPLGQPWPVGTTLRHPAYAQTLRDIAAQGPEAWWAGRAQTGLLQAAQAGFRPTLLQAQDLQDYRAIEREPLCAPFLTYRVCTVPPPSFGGVAVLQILQMVQARSPGRVDFTDPAFLHLFAEASKLAQADRRLYVGDPDHVAVPTQALVSPAYLAQRARQIDATRAMPQTSAGRPFRSLAPTSPLSSSTLPAPHLSAGPAQERVRLVPDDGTNHTQTSQLAVADRQGNVVSVTTTLNLNFGARLSFDGVVLNNAMTNFSAAPRLGERLANQMAPGKRPVTSMAPTIVFDAQGHPVLAGGSAGGGPIVDYVAASLLDILGNDRSPTEALHRPHLTTGTPGVLQLERARDLDHAAAILGRLGHTVEQVPLLSGQTFIKHQKGGWIGASDPRRDGTARGM